MQMQIPLQYFSLQNESLLNYFSKNIHDNLVNYVMSVVLWHVHVTCTSEFENQSRCKFTIKQHIFILTKYILFKINLKVFSYRI